MKRKYIRALLLVIGIFFICLSLILSIISTANKDVIGGADMPTFFFVFLRENKGLYAAMALCGLISIIISCVNKNK